MEHYFYAEENKIGIWDKEMGRSITILDGFASHMDAVKFMIENNDILIKKYWDIKGRFNE